MLFFMIHYISHLKYVLNASLKKRCLYSKVVLSLYRYNSPDCFQLRPLNKFFHLTSSSKERMKLHYITLKPLRKKKILQDLEQDIWFLVTALLLDHEIASLESLDFIFHMCLMRVISVLHSSQIAVITRIKDNF